MGVAKAPLCNLGNNISSKVLAFAFSLSAEIERSMISSRTKEALARKKHEGKRLGRPKGRLSTVTKLSGKEDLIREDPGQRHRPPVKRASLNRAQLYTDSQAPAILFVRRQEPLRGNVHEPLGHK